MDDKKGKTSSKRWILYGIILSTILIVGVFATLYFVNVGDGGVSYTWTDRSSGNLDVVEGTYYGKTGTLYLHDDSIEDFCSARFNYDSLIEGEISFYFRFDSDVSGDIVMQFYEGNVIFSDLGNMEVSLVSDTWYLITLKFNCEIDAGEVWIDSYFFTSGDFTISEADYNDGFVIKTDATGMINVYISMISIT